MINQASGPFTKEEMRSFLFVMSYLEGSERRHYEMDPCENHIWLDVVRVREAVERVQGVSAAGKPGEKRRRKAPDNNGASRQQRPTV